MSDRERLLTARRFAVDRVAVRTRRGGTVSREVVVHPGAVVILPLLDDGRVVLIRNRRFAVGETLWELPAGTLEPGEDPATCASRELSEETGYAAGEMHPMLQFYPSPGILSERMHAFVARGLRYEGQRLDDAEDIEVVPTSEEELTAMLRRGDVVDGKTLTVLLYHRYLAS